jgi:hypothetical protein
LRSNGASGLNYWRRVARAAGSSFLFVLMGFESTLAFCEMDEGKATPDLGVY